MRYNIGLGVGHTYTHGQTPLGEQAADGTRGAMEDDENELGGALPDPPQAIVLATGSESEESSIDRDDLDADWEDDCADRGESCDEEFFAMREMYGSP
jgi:hypothetical protein